MKGRRSPQDRRSMKPLAHKKPLQTVRPTPVHVLVGRGLAERDIGIRRSDVDGNAVIDPRQQRALVLDCCRAPPQRRGKPICGS